MIKKYTFAIVFTALFLSVSAQAEMYQINVGGKLISDNAVGDLGDIALTGDKRFSYNATFDLNEIKTTSSHRTNSDGYKKYALNQKNIATILAAGGATVDPYGWTSDSFLELEFGDNQEIDVFGEADLAFLRPSYTARGWDATTAPTAVDFIVFGFFRTAETNTDVINIEEFYLSLAFDATLFETDDNDRPIGASGGYADIDYNLLLSEAINSGALIFAAGEFAARGHYPPPNIEGFAQILGDSATVSAVPVPATMMLFSLGLLGLAGVVRKQK